MKAVLACLCLALTSAAQAAPRLAVPPEGVAFGELVVGMGELRTVEVRNVSSFPVAVSQVKGCCGADVELTPMVIAPNASATLSVGIKPRVPGEFSKAVRIFCDDPECPVVSVPLSGTAVVPPEAVAAAADETPSCERAVPFCAIAFLVFGAAFLLWRGRRRLSAAFIFESLARIGLGGLFVYAGAMKLCDAPSFAKLLARYEMLPGFTLGAFSVALPAAECAVGLALVFSRWVRVSAGAVSAMLVAFIVALAQAAARGLDVSCGCFGGVSSAPGGIGIAIARDVAFLVPALWLVFRAKSRPAANRALPE